MGIALEKENLNNETDRSVKKLKRDLFIYLPAVLIPALLSIVSIKIYTVIFNPNEYGTYSIILNTSLLFTTVLSQWVQQSIQKFRPIFRVNDNVLAFNHNLKYLILFIQIIFLTVSLIIFPFLYLNDKSLSFFFLLGVLVASAQSIFVILSTLMQSDFKSKEYRFFNVINAVLKLTISLMLVYLWQKDIISIFLGFFLSLVITIIPMARNTKIFSSKESFDKTEFLKFLKQFYFYGFPMLGWFLANMILNISDRYIIQHFWTSAEVGIYTANSAIVTSCLALICNPLLTSSHPIMMNASSSVKDKEFVEIVTKFTGIFLLITIPLVTLVSVLHKQVAQILLGQEFQIGSLIIPLLLVGNLFWQLGMYGHKGLEAKGKTSIMLRFVLICGISNIIFNFCFVPYYGYYGSAISNLISLFLYPFLIFLFSRRNGEIAWKLQPKLILLTLTASVISCVPVYFIREIKIPVLLLIVVCGLAFLFSYIVLLLMFKLISLDFIKSLSKKLIKMK